MQGDSAEGHYGDGDFLANAVGGVDEQESADGDACPDAGADVADFGGELERWAIRKETTQPETNTSAPW